MTPTPRRAAIVLAGGRATRLDGADKAQVDIGGRMLIDAVLQAVASCAPVIVVGPESLRRPGVQVVREDPPFGGPVAAMDAGLVALPASVDETWLLSCDLPRADEVVAALADVAIPEDADAVLLRDAEGQRQPLAARYRVAALRQAIAALGEPAGASMRSLLRTLRVVEIDDADGVSEDLDTWDDVKRFRDTLDATLGERPGGARRREESA